MKLVRFSFERDVYWGLYNSETQMIHTSLPEARGLHSFEAVSEVCKCLELGLGDIQVIPKSDVCLLSPVLPTKNILCIGKNYYDHILEFDGTDQDVENIKERPIFFSKALSSITGPDAPILLHEEVTEEVDYEAELAVVIGKRGINISKDEALEHVFGYTILNDVTARDLQKDHQQWLRGKSLDSHCPIGPWIVTRDEVPDPQNLSIQSRVNGELRQDSNTRHMIHTVVALIETLSKGMTLEVGDVIASGTPKGVGMGFDPPKFLRDGDRVELTIENIGTLVNTAKTTK